MALQFPSSPATGQILGDRTFQWRWNGSYWETLQSTSQITSVDAGNASASDTTFFARDSAVYGAGNPVTTNGSQYVYDKTFVGARFAKETGTGDLLTLPSGSGQLLSTSGTQAVTNKTIDFNQNNILNAFSNNQSIAQMQAMFLSL